MADILMVADPQRHKLKLGKHRTQLLLPEEFFANEKLNKAHDEALWQSFHTHGKYARIARHAEYFVVALDNQERYLGSAFIIPVGQKWLIEYVMTTPHRQQKGVGSAVMARAMQEAKKRGIQWCVLNCDPTAHGGILPSFYAKFGFKPVPAT